MSLDQTVCHTRLFRVSMAEVVRCCGGVEARNPEGNPVGVGFCRATAQPVQIHLRSFPGAIQALADGQAHHKMVPLVAAHDLQAFLVLTTTLPVQQPPPDHPHLPPPKLPPYGPPRPHGRPVTHLQEQEEGDQ